MKHIHKLIDEILSQTEPPHITQLRLANEAFIYSAIYN